MSEASLMRCPVFTPKEAPELDFYYTVYPGQEATFDQPGYAPEIDICDLRIHKLEVSETTYDAIMEKRQYWEDRIAYHLEEQALEDLEDHLIEAWQFRQLERFSA